MKKLIILVVILAVVVSLGFFSKRYWPNHSEPESKYETVEATRGPMTERVSATGPLHAKELVFVTTPISGEVVWIAPDADFNKRVKSGDILAQLDPEIAKTNLERAKLNVDIAVRTKEQAQDRLKAAHQVFTYHKGLKDRGPGVGVEIEFVKAEIQLDEAKTGLKAAETKIKEAKVALDSARRAWEDTTIRSPTDGVIVDRKVHLGQVAGPTSPPLFSIAKDLDHLELHAKVSEGDIAKVRVKHKAEFTVPPFPDATQRFYGTVREILPMPDIVQGAVYYDAIVDVDNKEHPSTRLPMLRPGMTATVDLFGQERSNAWRIPTEALSFQPPQDQQTPEAKAKLDQWDKAPMEHKDQWKPIWILRDKTNGHGHKEEVLEPIFVRTEGWTRPPIEETSITDKDSTEVLEWERGFDPEAEKPRVVTKEPRHKKSGLFGNFKLPSL